MNRNETHDCIHARKTRNDTHTRQIDTTTFHTNDHTTHELRLPNEQTTTRPSHAQRSELFSIFPFASTVLSLPTMSFLLFSLSPLVSSLLHFSHFAISHVRS